MTVFLTAALSATLFTACGAEQTRKEEETTTNEAKLIAYASTYQDVISGGTVTAPTAYFNIKVAVSQNAIK